MIGGDRDLSCCLACLPVSLPCSGQVERVAVPRVESPWRGLAPHGAEGGGERLWGKLTQILMMLLLVIVPTGKS